MSIDTGTSYKYLVDNGEDTFASDPTSVLAFDGSIVKDGSFVELNTTVVDASSKGDFVWMEIVEARFANHFVWKVAQNLDNGIRRIEDVGVWGKVYWTGVSRVVDVVLPVALFRRGWIGGVAYYEW